MPLEDFFTLGEMRDGLSSLPRVEELINVMQKQKDCVLRTISDAARQWSTVAGTFAATENKDCLDHFVQLNGLYFFNQWLQEAKCIKDVSANAMEELINALLAALERLPIDKERSTACGLGVTLEQLLGHENMKIKDRASFLLDKWNKVMVDEASLQDQEKRRTCLVSSQPNPSTDSNMTMKGVCSGTTLDISPCEGGIGESCDAESAGTEFHHSNTTRFTESSQEGPANCAEISKSDRVVHVTSSNSVGAVPDIYSLGSSLLSNSCHENLSVTEESSVCPAAELAYPGTCSSPTGRGRDDIQHHVLMFKDVNDGVIDMDVEVNKMETFLRACREKGTSIATSSSSLPVNIPVSATETQPCNVDSKGSDSCISNTVEFQANNGDGDHKVPGHLKIDSPEISPRKEVESASDTTEFSSDANVKLSRGPDLLTATDSSKIEAKSTGKTDQRSLEYEEIDALEVARQVAIEVEREVVDYREPFCSSPEVNSGEAVVHTSAFIQDKQDQILIVDGNRLPTENDVSDSDLSQKDITRIPEDTAEEHELTSESARVTSVTLESDGGKSVKSRLIIDLNEDIFTGELDCTVNLVPSDPINVSTPIAVLATSRAAQGLPDTPLHFERELGWRGSAATRAFRPASSRKTPDAVKGSSDLIEEPHFLRFDLNVAECGDGLTVDPAGMRQMTDSSNLPSGDYVEISLKRAERFKLDLNRLGDEDSSIYPSPNLRTPYQGGDQNLSAASSSCSKQSSFLDFDLNENPPFFDASNSHEIGKASCIREGSKLDDPVGMVVDPRMAFESREYTDHSRQLSLFPARQMISYHQMMPAPCGYTAFVAGRPMPIPPPSYGQPNIPYQLIDFRGFTAMTQAMTTASTRPPFLMSTSGAPSSFNGISPLQPAFDSGMTTRMRSMDGGSLSLFMQGHGDDVMEGPTRTSSNPSSSGMPLKRKELDRSQDSYPLG